MASQIRQNYHEDCEASINKQINMELYASYVYMSMAAHYDRYDVSLPGMTKFFKAASEEENEHAEKLMKFQNKRGGRLVLQAIACPKNNEYGGVLEGFQIALDLEKNINQSLLNLHKIASNKDDAHLADYLEKEFLDHQVETINKFGHAITQVKRAGDQGLGEYIFDKQLVDCDYPNIL